MSIVADPPLLISNAIVRENLNLKPEDDAQITDVQKAAIQILEGYVGRYFARRDDFVWTYRIRRPRKTLYLGIMPTLSISEVLYALPGKSLASGTEYTEDNDFELIDQFRSQVQKLCPSDQNTSDYIVDVTRFYKGYIKFTMNGGWGPAPTGSADATVEVPSDIKNAILVQMQFMLERNQVQGSKLIASQISIGDGGSINLVSPKSVHPQAQLLMNGYRQFWQ